MFDSATCMSYEQLLLFEVVPAIFLVESFDASSSIDKLLFASIERVTHRTDFRMDLFRCASRFKRVSATASDTYCVVFWMYIFLHSLAPVSKTGYYTHGRGNFNKKINFSQKKSLSPLLNGLKRSFLLFMSRINWIVGVLFAAALFK